MLREHQIKTFNRIISIVLILCFFISSFPVYAGTGDNLKNSDFQSSELQTAYGASYSSLINQINTTGIGVYPALSEQTVISPSGNDFKARVSYEINDPIYADYESEKTVLIKFVINNPNEQIVSFEYKIYSGSAFLNEHFNSTATNGTVTFEIGETEKQLEIKIPKLTNKPNDLEHPLPSNTGEFWTKDRLFYVNCFNISNALFDNDKENMTVPVTIENKFDLKQSYDKAGDIYLVNLSNLGHVDSFPDTPGKYLNLESTVEIATASAIIGDVRTMIDLGVFSHLNLLTGYFLNENGETGDINFRIDKNYIWGSMNAFDKPISVDGQDEIDFGLGGISISDIGFGRYSEANSIIQSLRISFDYSQLTQDVYTVFCDQNNNFVQNQMNFEDKINPYAIKAEVPAITFCLGENIPITVTYNEPVLTDDVSIKANGTVLYPMERKGTVSETVSFLYEVKEDYEDLITVTDITGAKDLSGKTQEESGLGYYLTDAILEAYDMEKLFSYCADTYVNISQDESINAKVKVTVSLKENIMLSNYLAAYKQADGLLHIVKAKVIGKDGYAIDVPLYVNDGPVITELRGEFDAPANTSDTNKLYVAEIYFDKNNTNEIKLLYALAKEYVIAPIIYIDDESDFEIMYTNWPSGSKVLTNSEIPISLSYNVKNNATWQGTDDFLWSSSDETVAAVTSAGAIALTGKAGNVRFKLTALNGGQTGKEFNIFSEFLEVVDSEKVFLNVPDGVKNIEITEGNDAKVYYTTNITGNNDSYAGKGTITAYCYDLYDVVYDGTELKKGDLVHQQTLNATVDNNILSYTIDKQYLVNTSVRGKYSYILEISARDLKSGMLFTAAANICVKSLPAKAILGRLPNYYITDEEQDFSIEFDVDNNNSETDMSLWVTKNNEVDPVFHTENIEDAGKDLKVDINEVDSDRLYDAYTVSLKAKNEIDEAYSYDSYVLYVYNSEALKIMVNGEASESHTMSLEQQLSELTSEEILNFNRNLILKDEISINSKQYKWSNIADKITWNVNDDSKLSLKYNDGGVYRNINDKASFLPGTSLLLEGISSGESYITATHDLTGIEAKLDVTVNELEDKLFIFQVYPVQRSTVEYINGNNESKIIETDDNGCVAIYEKSGIKSDVKFLPENTEIYDPFLLNKDDLIVNQKTLNYFGLYPQNNVVFQPAKYEVIFNIYDADEKDNFWYNGDVIIKGGIYRNGVYCPNAKINGKSGSEGQVIKTDGYLYTLNFIPTEFITELETDPIMSDDVIEYVIEISTPDNSHYPRFIKIDNESIQFYKKYGKGIVGINPVVINKVDTSKIQNNINILSQNLIIDGKEQTVPEHIIIEDISKPAFMNTEMMFEGDYNKSYDIKFVDENNKDWSFLSHTEVESYEFSENVIMKNVFDLQKYASYFELGKESSLYMQITIKDENSLKIINLPAAYRVQQLTGIPGMDTLLTGELKDIKNDIKGTIQGPSYINLGGMDKYIEESIKFIKNYSIDSDSVRLEIEPTDNPIVYKGIIKIALGEMSEENPSGVYSMDRESSMRYNFMPGFSDVSAMSKGAYIYRSKRYMEDSKEGYVKKSKTYGGGAYMECEIFYDIDDKEWKILVLKSDVYIGGGYYYKQVYNTWISFVPVTAEFLVGGSAQIGLKTILNKDYIDEETYNLYRSYITELRPYLYIKGFGGVGRDYDVVSFKAGPYGKIDLDQRYLWLNSEKKDSNGQQITVSGETGIEYEIKLLYVSVDGSFKIGEASKSWTYNDFVNIKKAYDSVNSKSRYNMLLNSYNIDYDDAVLAPYNSSVTFEDRSYLANDRQWYTPKFKAFYIDDMTVIQTNAYPYSDPVLTDDGEMMVYISDMNSADIKETAVCFSRKASGSFPEGAEIDISDYADTDAVIDGTAAGAAAAWTRIISDMDLSEGGAATDEDIREMMTGTEIMAGIYDGTEFITTRLTDNSTPDMTPVVATDGSSAIVAWRSLYAGDMDNSLDFDGRDNIVYKMFDGSNWSEEKCLYDGSIDKVNTINAEMLSDGTAAITYQIRMKDTENTEIYCAIIDKNGDIINNIRLTNNETRDENPCITSVVFPDKVERFVIGWNSKTTSDVEEDNKIRLSAVDGNGNIYTQFENEIECSDTSDYSSFKFTKGAEKLDDLSIVWTQSDLVTQTSEDGIYNYAIWGRKFIQEDDGSITVSPEIKLLVLDENNVVDFFDAYSDNYTKEINFALNITDYSTVEANNKLASAKSKYGSNIIIDEIYYSREELLPGLDTPILFRLYNEGVEPVEKVTVNIGGISHTFGKDNFIKPGEYKDITVFYAVPATIENPDYSINAEYSTSVDTEIGTLNMDVPDVGIYSIDTIKELGRQRMFSIQLHNSMFSKLAEGKHVIKLQIYDTPDFSNAPIVTETIADSESLNMINEGILIKNILLKEEDLQDILNEDGEIPEEGVRIFFNVVLEENGEIIDDADISNNSDYVKIRSLLTKNMKPVSITSLMQSEENKTVVQAEILNNSMNEITGGNIIVNLRDEMGNIIETKQTYDKTAEGSGLLTLGGEEILTETFNFGHSGTSFDVAYTGDILNDDSGTQPDISNKDKGKPVGKYINPFKDVKETDWFYEAVKFAIENGLMSGTGTDTFEPELLTTRGMLITVLYRLEKESNNGAGFFTDVAAGEYYSDAAAWAQKNGIVNGISETKFGPNENITREQFAAILYRYASFKGYDTSAGRELSSFTDSDSISGYAVPAMQWAVETGLIKGRGESTLAPIENTTRAEMAEILYRYIKINITPAF